MLAGQEASRPVMDVNRPPAPERDPADREEPGVIERVVRTEIPIVAMRPADVVAIPLAVVVAIVVCFPILVVTMVGVAVVTEPLVAVGLPPAVQGILFLVVGLGGGLAIGFVVLLRILRRLPRRVCRIAFELDEPPSAQSSPPQVRAAPISPADLAALDARLAPSPSDARESSSEQPDR
jgi:hypothetical protein